MLRRRLIVPVGLSALVSFVACNPFMATHVHADGAPACHLSASGHCVVPPSTLGVVETPIGPEVIGVPSLAPLVAELTHAVATTTGLNCVGTCHLPTTDVNGNVTSSTAAQADDSSGGYTNGGCAGNGTCSSLRLYWHQSAYWGNSQANDPWEGAVSYNDLWPTNQSASDSNEFDFLTSLASVSSNTWSVCSIQLGFSSDTSNSSPITWWPTSGSLVGSGSGDTLSLSGQYAGVGVSYTHTFTTSQGWVEGKISNQNGAPNFNSTWAYQNQNGQGAGDCNWSTVAIDGGLAIQTPTSQSFTMTFSADGTGYEGT